MASGLIPALRKACPGAHIAWLAEPGPAALLRANPRLDEVIVWPRPRWRELWKKRRLFTLAGEIRRFCQSLRLRGFTQALDTQGLLKSGVWARVSGASERIGLGSKEGSQHLMTRVMARDGDDRRIGAEYRALAAFLGCNEEDFHPDLVLDEDAAAQARSQRAAFGIDRRYAVIAPFTTRAQKHWFEPRWRQLAGRLTAELDLPVAMLGGLADGDAAARIAAQCTPVFNIAGTLGLAASAAMVRDASLLVGVDTGLTHMGTAFGIPTVALFGATRPYLDPDAPSTRIIYKSLPCAPCRYSPTCGGAYTCMRDIGVDEVTAAAGALLEKK